MTHENLPIKSDLDEEARRRIAESVERARRTGQTRWVALVVDAGANHETNPQLEDAIACYARAGKRDRFLFSRGDSEDFSVSFGVAHEIESAGPSRFSDVRAWTEAVLARIDWVGDRRPATAPTFFGGFGFESESRGAAEWKAFPAARFVLPLVISEIRDGEATRVFIARVEPAANVASVSSVLLAHRSEFEAPGALEKCPDSESSIALESLAASPGDWMAGPEFRVRADRSHSIYCAQIQKALDTFAQGSLSKLVLARSLCIDHDDDLDVPAFLGRLRALYPTCTLLAVGRGEDTFLAATPEALVRVTDDVVETAALAGSAPRGRHPEEDRRLAERLMSSTKERSEHGLVVDAIRAVLSEACTALETPASPTLRPLFGIQHLETPIRGRLKSTDVGTAASDTSNSAEAPVDVLALVEALHPTPAVGGFPRAAAEDWLKKWEGLDRGWYAAPVGFLDRQGGGDFRVALRSGLIRNGQGEPGRSGASRTLLFAGAGIVDGSVPEEELVETRIKLRALLAPLTEI
jgi:salicylate biosynthesis isochorismate synthase